jgi:hypothetical protein
MDFSVGQVCVYQDAIVPTSRIIIGRIDPGLKAGEQIISVTLTDIPLPDPKTGQMIPDEVVHIPIDAKALLSSVISCSGKSVVSPEFEAGYKTWKAAFDKNEAGIFTVSVGKLQGILAKMLSGN